MIKGGFFLKTKLTKVGYPHEKAIRLSYTHAKAWALTWMSGDTVKRRYLNEISELRQGSYRAVVSPDEFDSNDMLGNQIAQK